MKAVNLIPADQKAGRPAGRSGIAPYALLGVLAMLLVMSAVYVLAGRSVQDKQNELAQVTAQADATEAKAASYKDYTEFASMRKARVETVQSLANSRYDWGHALNEVARILPAGTWITSLRATVSPSVNVEGTPDSLRGSIAVPAIELAGCAKSHTGVAGSISALRRMSGVQRVSLTNSQKAEVGAGNTGTRSDGTGCGTRPQFSLTVFLEQTASVAGSSTAPGGTTP
jgi:Tfp pilus assembly protein PilN